VFTRFDISVRKRHVKMVAECLGTINAAIEGGDWRAARWVLERNGYRAPKQVEHSGRVKTGSYFMDEQDEECGGL